MLPSVGPDQPELKTTKRRKENGRINLMVQLMRFQDQRLYIYMIPILHVLKEAPFIQIEKLLKSQPCSSFFPK